jgi:uncharacterized protein (DUF58 family)
MMRVARWHGALVGALFTSAVGLYVGNYTLVLMAVVPLVYVVYGSVTDLGPPSLAASRALSDDHADPGDPVTVTLTVENTGDQPIPDLRIADDTPPDAAVVAGSPRVCTALRPGEYVEIEYDLLPPRGTHEFGDTVVRGRGLAGTVVGTTTKTPAGATEVACDTLLDDFPLQDETVQYAGKHPTDTGGRGVAFHSVREYRRGDSLSRIDWHRLASTGDLATVNHREERAASVVFVIDGRSEAALCPPRGGPTATDLSVYAAAQGLVTLTGEGHEVGVTPLVTTRDDYVPPGRGETTRSRAEDVLDDLGRDASAGADGADVAPDSGSTRVAADGSGPDAADGAAIGLRLAERLPSDAQVVLCTPLLDDVPVAVAEQLRARRYGVTLLSPNVARPTDGTPTPGQAVTDLSRRSRLAECTALGVHVTDWSPTDPLQIALAEMLEVVRGWSG